MFGQKIKIAKLINQNLLKIHLIVLIFLFSISIIYINIIENNLGNRLTHSAIQNTILSKETNFDIIYQNLQPKIENQKESFRFTEKDIKTIRKSELNVYIYHKDSLLSWSDNEAIPNYNSLPNTTTTYILPLADGQYMAKNYYYSNFTVCISYLLEHVYPFENEYLENHINKDFNISKRVHFNFNRTENYQVVDANNGYLFQIEFSNNTKPNINQSILLSIIYFLIIVLIYNFIYLLLKRRLKKNRLFLFFTMSIIGIRLLIYYFRLPEILFETELFLPGSFAISKWLPSLGDLFLSIFSLLIIILAAYQNSKPTHKWNEIFNKNKVLSWFSAVLILLLSFALFLFALQIIKNLIINSNINFNISDFSDLNYLSVIGLIIIAGTFLSVLIILFRLFDWYNAALSSNWYKYGLGLLVFAAILFLNYALNIVGIGLLLLYFLLIIILIFSSFYKRHYQLENFIPVLLLLSFITAIAMNSYNNEAEQLRRQAILRSVAINQDPQAEYLYQEIEKKIYSDSTLISAFHNNNISFDSITEYIYATYFDNHSHWKKYDLQATICDQEQELVIKPENITILCNDFFYKNLISFGSLTNNKNLYQLNYGTGQINYLGLFRFVEHTLEGNVNYTIYLEINSKLKRKGFTKLLSEKGNDPFEKIRNYSLATYNHDTLSEYYGQYSYPEILEKYMKLGEEMSFINHNNFNHLVYFNSKKEVYILSKKNPEQLSMIAPFSYLFILYALLFLVFSIIFNHSLIDWKIEINFTARLQLTMISIIVISFAIISYFSAHYIVSLNNEKNNQRLKDLGSSLQMEFEHKVRNINIAETNDNADYLQTLSNKFSKVFDTDINLYDLEGSLISSTRPEIFDHHLLSTKINPLAFYKLSVEKESFFVTSENIGELVYSSAFLPFHNSKKEVVAYLNLPYFARQSELQSEVSSFLMTLMNVYTFIIVLSIIVILLISNYISRPLRMIKEKMKKLTLGAANEKIEWKGQDEIGKLVEEYNRMADQLTIKADLLAKSERESAWREMAKQVAHEIKNPLTPMKLSVQYLLRSWNEKDPDWEDRLFRLSETLIQQIDTLSDIATAFSDFAKMPKSNNEKINLDEIIQHAVELYADYEYLQINFTYSKDHYFYVYADRKHLLRVFNNLIKNSIQSLEVNQNGFIDIDIKEEISNYSIRVRDNGCGIPEDKKKMIFVPNFTTKSKGTGLGLAMVKNIILSFGGHISFESEVEKGTVFTILLPKYEYLEITNTDE